MAAVDLLLDALDRRIVILDGAMGTMVQALALPTRRPGAATRCATTPRRSRSRVAPTSSRSPAPPTSRPSTPRSSRAGADIVETDTFTATSVALADYGLDDRVRDLNVAAARVARRAADAAERARRQAALGRRLGRADHQVRVAVARRQRPGRALDPLPRARRRVRRAGRGADRGRRRPAPHRDPHRHAQLQGRALRVRGRVRARAARRVPVIASVTIPDRSGRTLSGQTVEAFYNSIASARRCSRSAINCALGADDMRPHVAELARIAALPVACYPNAGLPNEFGAVRRHARAHGAGPRRVRARRPRQPRRRLLRHAPRPHRRDRARGRRRRRAGRSRIRRATRGWRASSRSRSRPSRTSRSSASARTSPARPRSAA